MRWLMVVLVAAVFLSCGEDRETPAGPSGKAAADCSLFEILSGKEGCAEDPTLDEVPEGYEAPVDSTMATVTDSTAAEPEPVVADTLRYFRLFFDDGMSGYERELLTNGASS